MDSGMGSVVIIAGLALVGCDPGGSDELWAAAIEDAPIRSLGVDGCLDEGTPMEIGERHHVAALDARWILLDGPSVRVVARSAVELEGVGDDLEGVDGRIARTGPARRLDADGCLEDLGEFALGQPVLAISSVTDASLTGWVSVGPELAFAPYREVDVDGWTQPWRAAVHLVAPLDDGGFVVGGGVLVGSNTILTADHLGVDEEWCWSRGPDAGVAWDAGDFVCGDVDEVTQPVDGEYDLAVVRLTSAAPGPFAAIREEPLQAGDPFFTNKLGDLSARSFADSTVLDVGQNNAWCHTTWPPDSTFLSVDDVTGPGDSGGPAWSGDELVGLVHGEACLPYPGEQGRHAFVHLPAILQALPEDL